MSGYSSSSTAAPPAAAHGAEAETRWSMAFEAVLSSLLTEYEGGDPKVTESMSKGMRKLFENPYLEELAFPGEPALKLQEAQRIVFFPRLSDMKRYVDVFGRDTPEATRRREQLLKFKLMSVFYSLHRKDGALVDHFMHCGGLTALVSLLAEDNRIIQSQVVELLMEFVSPLLQLSPSSSGRQGHLFQQVFQCLSSKKLWRSLAKIVAEPNEVFPKSHASCLRILAGALGWLRPEEGMPGGPGENAPGAAAAQGPQLATSEAKEALQLFIESRVYRESMPDIRGLSEDLLEELSNRVLCRRPPLEGKEALEKARQAVFNPGSQDREDHAHAWQALKQLGTDAFKKGLIWPAEATYRLALVEGGEVVPATEASLINSNLALVLLKAGHHEEAADAAAAALKSDPRNAKAAYRRAQALLELAKDTPAGGGDPVLQTKTRPQEHSTK
eukprot:TRINITY_DN15378_c0_g1_i1.p1 TRINITY_DN15378_c0_g1~~TRINITY_DN15378_c0_g1_i1.p1  ORF type:complete len:444 (-),score=115.46 TRINITY_DN15378_c0_g1_i1:287-1618(-)